MPKYAILIYGNYSNFSDYEDDQGKTFVDSTLSYKVFENQIEQFGAELLGGTQLDPAVTATSIHYGGALSDGPFVTSSQVLGGFYIISAKDIDKAIEIAKLCPAAGGGVEVRPIAETSEGIEAI